MANVQKSESDLTDSDNDMQQNTVVKEEVQERLMTQEDDQLNFASGSAAKSKNPVMQSQYHSKGRGSDDKPMSIDENRKAQEMYKSPVQVDLDNNFVEQFQYKAGNRRENNRDTEDRFDQAIVEHAETATQQLNKLFTYKAPVDAVGPKAIKSLDEHINGGGGGGDRKNPKTSFFELSGNYYTGKYKDENIKRIMVKSYLITEDLKNYINDMSMEIIQTHQGCVPVIKTFEKNAYDENKFVKALKFYDIKGPLNEKGLCNREHQLIVDEGPMCEEFKTLDTSLLHYENSIIFYQREQQWFKLQRYDVTTNKQSEIPGYNIPENFKDGKRLHIMFSTQFGSRQSRTVVEEVKEKECAGDNRCQCEFKRNTPFASKDDFKLHKFLSKHYVFCQEYIITEEIEYHNLELKGFHLHADWDELVALKEKQETKQKIDNSDRKRLTSIQFKNQAFPEGTFPKRPANEQILGDRGQFFRHPIQQVCHIHIDKPKEGEQILSARYGKDDEEETEKIIHFIAFDSFRSHHFEMKENAVANNQNAFEVSEFTSYFGNNESHLQESAMNQLKVREMSRAEDIRIHEDDGYDFRPFYKHANAQFTIQKEIIHLEKEDGKPAETIHQYFYLTNDNQYMLVYPNYEADTLPQMKRKQQIYIKLAERFQYNPNPDVDYDYSDDYHLRKSDWLKNKYKKVSHICINDYNSKNHLKRSQHIEKILKRTEDRQKLTMWDDIILSTDEQTNLIYVYKPQASRIDGNVDNIIEIYFYENNIVNTDNATSLPTQIHEMEEALDENFSEIYALLIRNQFTRSEIREMMGVDNNVENKKMIETRLTQKKAEMEDLDNQIYNDGSGDILSDDDISRVIKFIFAKKEKPFYTPHTTFHVNNVFKNVVACPNMIRTEQRYEDRINMYWLEEFNPHLAEDLKEKIGQDPKTPEQYLPLSFLMSPSQRQNYVLIENVESQYQCLKIRSERNIKEDVVTLEMYTRNSRFYNFFFSIVSQETKRVIYFTVQKNLQEIKELAMNNTDCIIHKPESNVVMFQPNAYNTTDYQLTLENYTQNIEFQDVVKLVHEPQPKLREKEVNIHLTFEKCMDNRAKINFVPLIYQHAGSVTHHIIIFDVSTQQVVRHFPLLPNKALRGKLRTVGDHGVYTLTRTSDVFEQDGWMTNHTGKCTKALRWDQVAKYQVSAQYQLEQAESKSIIQKQKDDNPANCTIEFQEFALHVSCCGQKRINLVGVKQMLVSQTATQGRKRTFDDLFVIPWISFDRSVGQQKIRGSQFVLRERIDDDPLQVIRMCDQRINKLYQHENETIQYGHQKFLTSKDTHEDYILVISSQFKQRVYMGHYFENSESYYVHHKVIKKLLSMKLAKFEYYVLNDDFEALMREEFYQAQEVLQGKSINDLCLGFPREVAQGLKQNPEQYKKIIGSLVEEVSNGEQGLIENYLKIDLCEYNLLIQMDFNFTSSLRIAAELNSNQAVKQIMTKIFELNDIKYQEIFMMEIPRLLQLPRIERLFPFLTRDYAEMRINKEEEKVAAVSNSKISTGKFLNMENVLHSNKLPQFLSKPVNYHIQHRFEDHHEEDNEIVTALESLKNYDRMKVKSIKAVLVPKKFRRKETTEMDVEEKDIHLKDREKQEQQKNVEVEHTYINFTKIIIGEKIRYIQEHDYRHVNFNDNHLASIFFVEDEEYLDFYDLEAVRKIIDFQFVRTKEFIQFIMAFYIIGFLIPYIITLQTDNVFFLNIFYIIMLFTQIFFMVFEAMQVKEQKWDYFKDIWNLIDLTQFLMFFILYCTKMKNQFQTDSFTEILIQSAVLLQCFGKMMYFVRVFESFNLTYILMYHVARDVYCIGIIAGMFLLSFTKQFTVMHYGVNDPDDEYKGIDSRFMRLIIQSYKSAKGEVSVPKLDTQMTDRTENNFIYRDIMKGLNLGVWVTQEGLFIFLGALFFAQVWQYAEKHFPRIETYMYKSKAKFNNECYDIVDMFTPQRNFKALCFAMAKSTEKSRMWKGPTNAIIEAIQDDYEKKKFEESRDKSEQTSRYSTMKDMTSSVDHIKKDLDDIYRKLGRDRQSQTCSCDRL